MAVSYDLLPFLKNEGEWTKEDTVAFEQAAMAYHNASFDRKMSEENKKKAEEEYLANERRRDEALNKGKSLPFILQLAGYIFVGLGVMLYAVDVSRKQE